MTIIKYVRLYSTSKFLLTGTVRCSLKLCDAALTAGDTKVRNIARKNLKTGITEAKRRYEKKLCNHFTDTKGTRHLFNEGFHAATYYKSNVNTEDSDHSLIDNLNLPFSPGLRLQIIEQHKGSLLLAWYYC